jgi:hypothetical protein
LIPRARRTAAGAASAALVRLHSGGIGDSATWVTPGTAGVGLVLALQVR